MGKISNVTNSTDPTSVLSRVFCGNLNTFTLTKDDVEQIFTRYGRIIGISMHKGYAFIQYTNENDARKAVTGEDQRIYAAQPIDVNLAAEPKPNRPSRKRPQGAGAEWDYYYNVMMADCRPAVMPPRLPMPPPLKRPRPDLGPCPPGPSALALKRTLVPLAGAPVMGPRIFAQKMTSRPGRPLKTHTHTHSHSHSPSPVLQNGKGAGDTTDILICGTCRETFNDVDTLAAHKRVPCRLRFSCKCSEESNKEDTPSPEPSNLTCAQCGSKISNAWELIQHCQNEHHLSIFVPKDSSNETDLSRLNGDIDAKSETTEMEAEESTNHVSDSCSHEGDENESTTSDQNTLSDKVTVDVDADTDADADAEANANAEGDADTNAEGDCEIEIQVDDSELTDTKQEECSSESLSLLCAEPLQLQPTVDLSIAGQ